MTMEDLIHNDEGRLLTDTASNYKVPDIKFTPETVEVHFLEDEDNPYAVLNSKAIGEPPFIYGIGAFFALLNAMKAFRPEKELFLTAPLTPERILTFLYEE